MGVVGFTRIRTGGRWVHPGLLGSVVFALGSLGWSGIVRFNLVRVWLSLGSSGVVCSLLFALGVVGFALAVVGFTRGRWVHLGFPWGSLCSSGVVWFTRIRPRGR